jgi:ribonuclease P protein component|tara:strand:+ start:133 stop:417 length:285 start_codon:yes stop_codon:yes gene_type:complete
VLSRLPKHFHSSKNCRIFFLEDDKESLRISISKKNFKLAVSRNKIKRRIKEIFRIYNLKVEQGCFLVFVYPPFSKLKYSEASVEMVNAVKSHNL